MKKTTREIPDAIFRRAKAVAAERGIPFRALVSEALADKLRAQGYINKKLWMKDIRPTPRPAQGNSEN